MLKKLKSGTYAHHSIEPDEAHICVDRNAPKASFDVYRPDGLYAKRVTGFHSFELAEQYCTDHGWTAVRA